MAATTAMAAEHPCLLFTKSELQEMKAGRADAPLFDATIGKMIADADEALTAPIVVPVPVDGGGGPVHEQHKTNYYELMHDGVAYQFTGDKKYAERAAKVLEAYAQLYPTLGYHPLKMSGVPGRLFWQTLNESVWLVHVSVAYDCIRDALSAAQRKNIEENLLVPMADFIMQGTEDNRANLKVFNKMHNHGTWATAAVGMAGMAMERDELVDKALYGTDKTGEHGGFLQQMDYLFSPDGYFTEGAYYQRYAIWPFAIFAQCIDHVRPDVKVFEKRDKILEKAFDVLFQLSYEGEFMHFNDALIKGLSAQELVYAANILHAAYPDNKTIPYAARLYQGASIPALGGYRLSKQIAEGNVEVPPFRTALMRDGREGNDGGVGVIRGDGSALTLKATSHGLSHGHYDKLTMAFYDNGSEILSDYGAARFINLEAKNSGHYTKENDTFCKQTIAHNTLVADGESHFGGNIKTSSKYHSDFTDLVVDPAGKYQAMSARDDKAYAAKAIVMERALVQATLDGMDYPVTLDLMHATATDGAKHAYDIPYWYRGHMVSTNTNEQRALNTMNVLGDANGYQHIWVEADCKPFDDDKAMQFTFFNGNRMYSLTTAASAPMTGKLLRLGANDPNFNLRSETGWLVQLPEASNATVATLLEPHGQYDILWETAAGTKSAVKNVSILADNDDHTAVAVDYGDGRRATFYVAKDADAAKTHTAGTHSWTGHYSVVN